MGYEIDFISVGEGEKSGDAIALRFGDLKSGKRDAFKVVVVDGGFKESGGEQLVTHIKKYYGTSVVDLAISTHPDADHISGLEVVINDMDVKELWMHQPWKHTGDISKMFKDGRVTDKSVKEALKKSLDQAQDLEKLAQSKKIPITEPFTGVALAGKLYVAGPTKNYYEGLLPGFRGTPEPKENVTANFLAKMAEAVKKVAETFHFETLDDSGETSAENNSSVILLLNSDEKYSLLTSDAGIPALNEVIKAFNNTQWFDYSKLNFMQVPHHGSHRNIGPTILNKLIGPKLKEEKESKITFVSVAEDSDSKHPSKKVMNAFRRRGAPVHATKGKEKRHAHDAPDRERWVSSVPLPFYSEVED